MQLQPVLRSALLLIATSLMLLTQAQAAAPMVKTQAPGYYRMMLGDIEVTALLDGTVALNPKQLFAHTPVETIDTALAQAYDKAPVETSVNGFLINTGSKLVLIDTGAANLFGPTLGNLVSNLKAAGYKPDDIDEIYITHMHPDHVGGLMAGDKLAFPNAIVRADKQDADHWLDEANMAKATKDTQRFFQGAMASLKPYVTAGKFQSFDGDTDLAPGIRAVARHGHTPGHTAYMIESKGEKMLVWGDLVHVAALQFGDPAAVIGFDVDTKAGAAQRNASYTEAAKQSYWIAAAHTPFPGIGHVKVAKKGFVWVPASYRAMR